MIVLVKKYSTSKSSSYMFGFFTEILVDAVEINDEQIIVAVHGSSVSLVSTASSLYSSAEEKQAHELRKLRRELLDAQEKVHSLTSQLSTNVSN